VLSRDEVARLPSATTCLKHCCQICADREDQRAIGTPFVG
jgi:hypothetical protein